MRRLKKTLKYLALIVGALIAVALFANAIAVGQTGSRLEERLSKLRVAGEPLSLPELGAMPASPGADAAAVLKRIEPELKALAKEINPLLDDSKHPRPWPEADWKALESAYANHPTVLPALAEAAACPSYKSSLNYLTPAMTEDDKTKPNFIGIMLPHIQTQREAANALKCRAQLQLRAKDRDGAMRTCLIALRIARHTEREPMMISYLVVIAIRAIGMGMANEILHSGPVAADLHTELEAELAKFDSADAYRWSLRSERAYGLQALEEQNYAGWFGRGLFNDEKCFYLDQMAECIAQADTSYARFQADTAAATAVPGIRHALARLVLPAIAKVREADFRVRCLGRSLQVVNALTAKDLKDVPANLADLGLPAKAVTDPYTDKPLIVKRVDGQWVVYGLGPNLKDEGGKLDKLEDVGYGPVKDEK